MISEINLSGLIVIWGLINVFMIVLFVLLGMIPGINLLAIPILMFINILMNIIIIFWILMLIISNLEKHHKLEKKKK